MRRPLVVFLSLMIAGSVVAPATTLAGSSSAPSDLSDITSSAIGQELAREAAAHRVRLGAPSQPLRVLRDQAGYLVVPIDTEVVPVSGTDDSGRDIVMYAPVVKASASDAVELAPDGALSSSWTQVYTNCYGRISDSWSWMDHCTKIFKLSNDGDGSKDYYALQHYATASGNWPWHLWWGKISSSPIVSGNYGAQTWVDWSPKSDYSGNCRTIGLSVTALGFGLGFTTEQCESYHFTKDNPAVNYSLKGSWYVGPDTNRELAYEIAVKVNQGKSVAWTVPAEVHGGV